MSICLHVHRWGTGPRVVLVHGGVLGGQHTWRAQRQLSDRWTLLAPDRPGHGQTPPARTDFDSEGRLLADQLLTTPAHLVGFSYGGIVAMYAAARQPGNVMSLTLIEPPATAVGRGVPEVDTYGAQLRTLLSATETAPDVALRQFLDLVGAQISVDDPPAPLLIQGMKQLLGARSPDEADPPLDALGFAQFPMLVVSGGHSQANEVICDIIADRTGAMRAMCPGMGHLVPDTGAPFNRLLAAFLTSAETGFRGVADAG
jgi:pimeloyl-ACP methyl ester carboxylesterase